MSSSQHTSSQHTSYSNMSSLPIPIDVPIEPGSQHTSYSNMSSLPIPIDVPIEPGSQHTSYSNMSSLPIPSDVPMEPEYKVVICDHLLRLTATAWVQMPEYDSHPKAFKDLLMSFLLVHDDPRDADAKTELVYGMFDSAYEDKLMKEEATVNQRRVIGDTQILEVESTPVPIKKNKGKNKAVDNIPPSREQTSIPDKGKTVPEPLKKQPLDIARKKQIANEKATKDVMENWIRAGDDKKTGHRMKTPKDAHLENIDSEVECIDAAIGHVDKSLFKHKAGSSHMPAGPSRLTSKPYSKALDSNQKEPTSKKRKRVRDSGSPYEDDTNSKKRMKTTRTSTEQHRATSTVTEFDPTIRCPSESPEAILVKEDIAPASVFEALGVLVSLVRENVKHAKTTADTVGSIKATLAKVAHTVTETTKNTEDIHLSLENLCTPMNLYFSNLADDLIKKR